MSQMRSHNKMLLNCINRVLCRCKNKTKDLISSAEMDENLGEQVEHCAATSGPHQVVVKM